jgi:hypothetical protein
MPQCQFSIFCCFCFSEKLHRKYSRNWTKQKPNLLFLPKLCEDQRWDRGGPQAGHTLGWRGLPLARATRGWGRLAHLLTPPFRLYIPLDGKKLKTRSMFQKHIAIHHCHRPEIGRVQKLFLAPCRRGKSPLEVFFIAMPASGAMSE